MHRRSLFALALMAGLLLAPSALASRRLVDVTDRETKEFCKENPDKCETKILWLESIMWIIGVAVLLKFVPAGIRYISVKLNPTPLPGERNYKRPADYE
jgi:hypothetical protein